MSVCVWGFILNLDMKPLSQLAFTSYEVRKAAVPSPDISKISDITALFTTYVKSYLRAVTAGPDVLFPLAEAMGPWRMRSWTL